MKEIEYNTEDPITALATGWEESALGVIRTSGNEAIELFSNIFSNKTAIDKAEGNTVIYGWIKDPATGEKIDEVLASVFRAPKSYTGEDSVEISCHGGVQAISGILNALKQCGFRDAAPGEFTMRAFINGKIDLTRAEAVHEIVTAKTRRSHLIAIGRLSGTLEEKINNIKQKIITMLSEVELLLDYPEDELDGQSSSYPIKSVQVEKALYEVDKLLKSYRIGKIFKEGVPVALAGRTNAGKSSLFNMLLREDRAIVSEIPGTTRDYIESWISVGGIPLRVFDTAGLRESDNPIEAEGIKRSGDIISDAGIILYLVDSAIGILDEDLKYFEKYSSNEKFIKIWSKIDSNKNIMPEGFIGISSFKGDGLEELEEKLIEASLGKKGIEDSVVIDSIRQRDLLFSAKDALIKTAEEVKKNAPLDVVAMELSDALSSLGEITGEVSSADILENIFSNFCVGK